MRRNKLVRYSLNSTGRQLTYHIPEDYASSKEDDEGTEENQEEFDDNNDEASYPSDPSLT